MNKEPEGLSVELGRTLALLAAYKSIAERMARAVALYRNRQRLSAEALDPPCHEAGLVDEALAAYDKMRNGGKDA